MAPATALEKSERDRENLSLKVDHWKQTLANHNLGPPNLLTVRKVTKYLESIVISKTKLEDIHDKIRELVDPADLNSHNKEYLKLYDKLVDLDDQFEALRLTLDVTPPPTAQAGSKSADIRLPRLNLPTFDGTLTDWMSFHDMFTAAVHNNSNLQDSQKLTYLKSSLTAEAARQVRTLSSTDSNYDVAWKLLTDRYQNDRELLFSTLQKFMNHKSMQVGSAADLRSLVDTTTETTRSLETLGQPVDKWDSIFLFILFQKLDQTSKELWEQNLKDSKIPPLQDFLIFVAQRARALQAVGSKSQTKPNDHQQRKVNQVHHAQQASCKMCKGDHIIHKCSQFLSLAILERIEVVKRHSLCFNCLREGHSVGQCTSTGTCRTSGCRKKHHTLIHIIQDQTSNNGSSSSVLTHHTNDDTQINQTLLATAIVKVTDSRNQQQLCRVLLDGGSTSSFVTEACVQRLGLNRSHTSADIVGLAAASVGTAKGIVSLQFTSHFQTSNSYCVRALILPRITGRLPVYLCDSTVWPHIQDIQLADPQFHKPAQIDILLGADIFWNLLMDGSRTGPPGSPIARRSTIGWLIGGNLDSSSTITQSAILVHYAEAGLDESIQRFWELESVPEVRALTSEERACEDHFERTHSINSDGRFTVKLPMKTPQPVLGTSREIAIRRLRQIENRISKQPEVRKQYNDFMNEYISLGHMTQIPSNQIESASPTCYIPHHHVIKESSTTTKLRVVFDASAKTSSGNSLNQAMMVGPVVQDSLFNILMRFRKYSITFTADIEKMYRQIPVTAEDTDLQRIVWRDDVSKPIQEFKLKTVTYGTASAPYLATKVLQQLAKNNQDSLPLASKVLLEDTYVDDVMSGAPSIAEAIKTKDELLELTQRGCLSLRKWSSNCKELLLSIPPDLRDDKQDVALDTDKTVKALGIHWSTKSDNIIFKVSTSMPVPLRRGGDELTKRILLSEMSQVYDPIGWLAPIIIKPKILIQQLWKLNIGWDIEVPSEIQQQWSIFKQELPCIEAITMKRCLNPTNSSKISLIGFCDASERAYAAAVYVKAEHPKKPTTISLVAAKTRVAPVKTISLPRLELCGAVLLSDLMTVTQTALKMNFQTVRAFTDSTVVLAWIQSHPSRWKTFVANRVTQCQDNIPISSWGHVSGTQNPADCASRGLDPSELKDHHLWWTGPDWLLTGEFPKIGKVLADNSMVEKEVKNAIVCATTSIMVYDQFILKDFSCFKRLKRVTAWCLRFFNNFKRSGKLRTAGPLTPMELEYALYFWIKRIQDEAFSAEIKCLNGKKPLPVKTQIRRLNPFIDPNNILRVGGRLRHANLPNDQRTPILLPQHHLFTTLLIMSTHLESSHGGPQLVQSILTRRFWIIGARDAIRYRLKKCIKCTRHSAQTLTQFMGDLPPARVNISRPFDKTGVDYAGPFLLRPVSTRSKTTYKAYMALFICFVTRAVHLELVSSLSTDAFMATLRRFVARRGRPSEMFSDAGTNFVGAARELRELGALINSSSHNQKVADSLANSGIKWNFNPPGSPHFGGLWEAGVKSVKHHLYRVIGSTRLTFEEMTTTLAQIESCLNSRPLTPFSSDPSDLAVLTPGHFLIGAPLTAVPDLDFIDEKIGRLSRWQVIQHMYQSFWNRWSNEYITRLQQRPKWLNVNNQIEIGNMVLIKDERLPPLHWKLGRVIDLHPGPDGIVRVVTIKTAESEIKRPLVKICLLPIDPAKANDNTVRDDVM